MGKISIKIKMGDGTRSQGLEADADALPSELLNAVIEQWALEKSVNYEIANETKGNAPLQFNQSLASQGVTSGDVLTINGQGVGG